MSQKVRITIKGLQGNLSEDEEVEMIVIGDLYEKNGQLYIHYIDYELDTEAGVKTSVKIEDHLVTIGRFGTVGTQMIFEEGVQHLMPYTTAFGVFDLSVTTKQIDFKRSHEEISLMVSYYLEMNQEPIGDSVFQIHATLLK